jgi:phosphoglucomutase
MKRLREDPPAYLAGSKVVRIKDFQFSSDTDVSTGKRSELPFPKSNVLQFFTEDGYKVTARPSGTEPKIKFYIGLKAEVSDIDDLKAKQVNLKEINDKLLKEITGE